jgi:hypothetical protein
MRAEPTNSADVAQLIDQRLAALKGTGDVVKETVTIDWRGQQLSIPVISMPLKLLKYNPDTHRIRAQRTLDPARDEKLSAEPYGPDGQDYLHYLLMGAPADPTTQDPDFLTLKEDLDQHGQTEPGIITRAGVLINGNTRAAALKELGRDDIRVGVLPPDAASSDTEAVELALQLRPEHRREYSFMNTLLAIEERRERGATAERICAEFRIRQATLDRNVWILAAVKELIKRSRTKFTDQSEHSLNLIDFERHQGKLEELYRAYNKMKAKSPDEAEAMREQRLLAIALDRSKTDVRLIGPGFSKEYMPKLIPDPPASTDSPTIPGTTVKAAQPAPEVAALRSLTDKVLKARVIEEAGQAAPADLAAKAGDELSQVRAQLFDALAQADIKAKQQKRKAAPVDRLSDANEALEQTLELIAQARGSRTFEPEDLDDVLLTMRENLRKLARAAARGVDESSMGQGLRWLGEIAAMDQDS